MSPVHKPRQILPLTVQDIKNIVRSFSKLGKVGLGLIVAVFIVFFTLLREANLLQSMSENTPNHTLLGWDLKYSEKALVIYVRSTKTSSPVIHSVHLKCVFLPFRVWGAAQWKRGAGISGHRHWTLSPAFLNIDGSPLLATTLLWAIRSALTVSKHPAPQ